MSQLEMWSALHQSKIFSNPFPGTGNLDFHKSHWNWALHYSTQNGIMRQASKATISLVASHVKGNKLKDIHPTQHMWRWLGFSWLTGDGGFCNHESHNIWIHVWSNPSVLKLLLSFFLPVTANKNGSPVISSTLSIGQDVKQLMWLATPCQSYSRIKQMRRLLSW
jgi:hypothetical protein